jgi:hypothetical protein
MKPMPIKHPCVGAFAVSKSFRLRNFGVKRFEQTVLLCEKYTLEIKNQEEELST